VALQVRGKAGARIEFGDKLWLGETREGVIGDYRLEKDSPADTTLVGLRAQALHEAGIKSGLCPRNPEAWREKLADDAGFGPGLKRRGGTEARIAIFKTASPAVPAGPRASRTTSGCWPAARSPPSQQIEADPA